MKLTPKQLKLQQEMVKLIHPGLSLKEALDIEMKNPKCLKIAKMLKRYYNKYGEPEEEIIEGDKYDYTKGKIIGFPTTLSRVLNSLNRNNPSSKTPPQYHFIQDKIFAYDSRGRGYYKQLDRKLLNDDGSDTVLRDQSQETQDIIYSLICGDDGIT